MTSSRTPSDTRMSRQAFMRRLRENHEDTALIRTVETHILTKRREVFRMPPPGSAVVLLLSGGMDSIVAWEVLLKTYRLHVYPLVVQHGRGDMPLSSVRFFRRYFRNKYPARYHEPYVTDQPYLDGVFQQNVRLETLPPEVILERYDAGTNLLELPFRGSNIFTSLFGALYGQYLSLYRHDPVTTVIYGATADDGGHIPSQTYAFLRLTMLMLMTFVHRDDIQLGSVFYEQSLGAFLNKRDVLALGMRLGIPMHKTYSCDRRGILHCGYCLSCQSRKYCFAVQNIPDRTWYLDQGILGKIGRGVDKITSAVLHR